MKRAYLLVLIFALAACSHRDPVANDEAGAGLPTRTVQPPDMTGAPPANAVAATTAAPAPQEIIPAALRGRWGLTPMDCTSTRGDAKGLLVVSAGGLKFYESRAVPVSNLDATPVSVRGNFRFNGEGESWTKFESLQLQDSKLVRTEDKPVTTFTYARC
jgi:hypothetical protein